tara:strand:+ start:863 stop:1246 length:384 start_codon:yes stop_codon:yes gene_type:complete
MVLPLEEQFQAEMGARLNPRQLLSKPLSYSDIAPEQMAIAREQLGQQPGPTSGILPSGKQLRPSYTDALSSSLGGQIQGGQAALDAGLTEIPTEIKYFGNSNQNPNVWGQKYIDRSNIDIVQEPKIK